MKDDVVIVGAARTAVGSFNGAFGSRRHMSSAQPPSRLLSRAQASRASASPK